MFGGTARVRCVVFDTHRDEAAERARVVKESEMESLRGQQKFHGLELQISLLRICLRVGGNDANTDSERGDHSTAAPVRLIINFERPRDLSDDVFEAPCVTAGISEMACGHRRGGS